MKIYVIFIDGGPEGFGNPECAFSSQEKAREGIKKIARTRPKWSIFEEKDYVIVETELHE